MKPAVLLLSGLALLCVTVASDRAAHAEEQRGAPGEVSLSGGFENTVNDRLRVLERAAEPQKAQQVRIERRVVIRISPGRAASARLMAELPRRSMATRFQEADHADCLPLSQLASVQPMGHDRLLLITQDRHLLSAALDRSCSAQAFYAGFYVERNEDGRLCVNRDELQSRAGDTCRIASLSRLIAVSE